MLKYIHMFIKRQKKNELLETYSLLDNYDNYNSNNNIGGEER